MRYLILGSGPAGIAAAKAARKTDKDAEVLIATEEHAAPYLRPLLPDLVSGEREPAALVDPQGKNLAESGVKLLGGKRARRVDAAKNRVTFSDGTEETYNFLCVATGGRPDPAPRADGGAGLVPLPELPRGRAAGPRAGDALRHDGRLRPRLPRHRGRAGDAEAGEPGDLDQPGTPAVREPHLRGGRGAGRRPAPRPWRQDPRRDRDRRRDRRRREELRRW